MITTACTSRRRRYASSDDATGVYFNCIVIVDSVTFYCLQLMANPDMMRQILDNPMMQVRVCAGLCLSVSSSCSRVSSQILTSYSLF